MKTLPFIFAGLLAVTFNAYAADAPLQSVEAINKTGESLLGKTVRFEGKVVKVNNGIMKRNFIHVQDGTGDANSNNLIVTSTQTAAVGDQVTVSGVVMINRDFGSGYMYPLLVENASITPKQ